MSWAKAERRCNKHAKRSYREYDRSFKRYAGRHSRWWEEGQDHVRWQAYAAENGLDPNAIDWECPF